MYVSRDYLHSDIVTNDLVKDNEGCLDLVKEALRSIDSGNCDDFLVTARKSLEIPVLVGYVVWERSLQLSCYFPREDRSWCLPPALCMLPQSVNQSKTLMCQMPQYIAGMPMAKLRETEMRTSVTSHGKIYLTLYNPRRCCHHPEALPYLVCYDSFSNSWKLLPFKDSSKVCKMFVGSSDEIYALVSSDNLGDECRPCKLKLNYLRKRYNGESHSVLLPWGADCPGHMYTVTKYKPKSNSWENIISFKMLQKPICVVAKDNYLYFIGGRDVNNLLLTDAERFDLSIKTWEKISDTQEPRYRAVGAAVYGNIFVTVEKQESLGENWRSCEMYTESTNEWQFIANRLNRTVMYGRYAKLLCVDDQLYVVTSKKSGRVAEIQVDRYDPSKDEWQHRASRKDGMWLNCWEVCCSMRVSKGSKFLQEYCTTEESETYDKSVKRKCNIM